MNKRIPILGTSFLLLVALITLVSVWLNRATTDDDEITAVNEPAEILKIDDGWGKVTHSAYGISIELPENWKTNIYESGEGAIEANYQLGETSASVLVYKFMDDSGRGIEDIKTQLAKIFNVSEIEVSEVAGLSYVGQDSDEDVGGGGVETESYVVGRSFVLGENILDTKCVISGPEYANLISECNRIVESMTFMRND